MSNDDMKLTLEKLRKDLEKTLIQTLIAPASVQTANKKTISNENGTISSGTIEK